MQSTRILKNFLKHPTDELIIYLDNLKITLPKDKNILNLASACIRKIDLTTERQRIAKTFMEKFPNEVCIQKMSRCVLASSGRVSDSIQLIKNLSIESAAEPKKSKGVASKYNYTFSNLRDIAVSGRDTLTEADCDQLLDLWIQLEDALPKGIDTVDDTKETFFSILVSLNPVKYLDVAMRYVWVWKNELWDLFPSKVQVGNITLQQPTINTTVIYQELVNELSKSLNQTQVNHLLSKIKSFKLPENSVIIDGSNLYLGHHFNYQMICKAELLLKKQGLIPVFVGQHYRIKTLNSYSEKRIYFQIPRSTKNCSDDTVWQLIALIHQKKFFTKDIARDHRKQLSQQFYLWYMMHWIKRIGSTHENMQVEMPPIYWKRAQIQQEKLYLPDPLLKDSWWMVEK